MEEKIIKNTKNGPVTRQKIIDDLREIGVTPGMTLLVHSSLSSMGWVCGGAVSVVSALQDVIRPYGLLIMPSHSGELSDPSGWENPPVPESWWDTIRETMPPFDPEVTPTRGMGAVAECFRAYPDTLRSYHPQFSFTAWGEEGIQVVQEHSLEGGLGNESPLGRIYDRDGWVLLLGVGFENNTSFHLSEWMADHKSKKEITCSSPVLVEGHRKWKRYRDLDYDDSDFGLIGRDFERKNKNLIKTGYIGNAKSYLFSQRLCVDFGIDWMKRKR